MAVFKSPSLKSVIGIMLVVTIGFVLLFLFNGWDDNVHISHAVDMTR